MLYRPTRRHLHHHRQWAEELQRLLTLFFLSQPLRALEGKDAAIAALSSHELDVEAVVHNRITHEHHIAYDTSEIPRDMAAEINAILRSRYRASSSRLASVYSFSKESFTADALLTLLQTAFRNNSKESSV